MICWVPELKATVQQQWDGDLDLAVSQWLIDFEWIHSGMSNFMRFTQIYTMLINEHCFDEYRHGQDCQDTSK